MRAKRTSLAVRWTKRAERDLGSIGDFIAQDDPRAALRWIEKLVRTARAAATLPRAGRVVPEFDDPDIREVFLRTYRIVYRVRAREIQVLAVFNGNREMPEDVDIES